MKDPLDPTERPYEVLGVSPSIAITEVQKAYLAFTRDRRNVRRKHAAGIAYNDLRRQDKRLADEILYYDVPSEAIEGLGKEPPADFTHEPTPPDLTQGIGALVAECEGLCAEPAPLVQRRVTLSDVRQFEEQLLCRLPIRFPA